MRRNAFSLIELLTVTAIIAILVGMISSAAFAARQQAYRAQAQTESRELANALRSYWVTYGNWPPELQGKTNVVSIGKEEMLSLIADPGMVTKGNGWNKRRIVFFDVSDKSFGNDNADGKNRFLDPWGNAYRVALSDATITRSSLFTSSVAFPMRDRYAHPGNQ